MGPIKLKAEIEKWPLSEPFCITGHTFHVIETLLITLEVNGSIGRGEAVGVYYKNDRVSDLLEQVERMRPRIEAGIDRKSIGQILSGSGARNAMDCALWDLEAKLTGRPAWQLANLPPPHPLLTTFGCGADTPERMASAAKSHVNAQAIKIKLTGDPIDIDRVRAVREARPDVWLGVDANQGFRREFLESVIDEFVEARVQLIEQPFPVGEESLLDGLELPIDVAADESAETIMDLEKLSGRFDVVNIKLDKVGGLTDALAMTMRARDLGLRTMVGNMIGTSLAMAPAFLVGQLCDVVDLDGPLFLSADRTVSVRYDQGLLTCPSDLWGYAESSPAPSKPDGPVPSPSRPNMHRD